MGLVLIPYSRSFFTRIPHPEIHSLLSRISFSSGSRTSVKNFLDQYPSKALISLVPDLHYLLFSEKGALLCHHPYCFPSQSQTLFAIDATSPVKVKSVKSRIPLTFPESSAVFWADPQSREYPSCRPGKNQNQHPLTCQLHIQQRQVKLCITISVKVNFVTKYA